MLPGAPRGQAGLRPPPLVLLLLLNLPGILEQSPPLFLPRRFRVPAGSLAPTHGVCDKLTRHPAAAEG